MYSRSMAWGTTNFPRRPYCTDRQQLQFGTSNNLQPFRNWPNQNYDREVSMYTGQYNDSPFFDSNNFAGGCRRIVTLAEYTNPCNGMAVNFQRIVYEDPQSNGRFHPYSGNNLSRPSRFYECYTCGKKLPSFSRLWSHKREAHQRTYYCRICNKAFNSLYHVKEHQRTHVDFVCQHCPETFRFKESLVSHVKESHKNRSLDNNQDGKSTAFDTPVAASTPTQPNHQIEDESNPNDKTHKCPHCIKKFDSSKMLTSHLKIHTAADENGGCDSSSKPSLAEKQNFSCPFCIKQFTAKRLLCLHMAAAHTRVVYCPQCTAQFETDAELCAHSKNHAPKQ